MIRMENYISLCILLIVIILLLYYYYISQDKKNYFTILFIVLLNYKVPINIIAYSVDYSFIGYITVFITCPLLVILNELYKNKWPNKYQIISSLVVAVLSTIFLRICYNLIDLTIILDIFQILFIPFCIEMMINSEGLIEMGHNPDKIKSIITYNSDRSQDNNANVNTNVSGDNGVRSNEAVIHVAPVIVRGFIGNPDPFYVIGMFSLYNLNNERITPIPMPMPMPNDPRLHEAYQYYIRNTESPQTTNWITSVSSTNVQVTRYISWTKQYIDLRDSMIPEERGMAEQNIITETNRILNLVNETISAEPFRYSRGPYTISALLVQQSWHERFNQHASELLGPRGISSDNVTRLINGPNGHPSTWALINGRPGSSISRPIVLSSVYEESLGRSPFDTDRNRPTSNSDRNISPSDNRN